MSFGMQILSSCVLFYVATTSTQISSFTLDIPVTTSTVSLLPSTSVNATVIEKNDEKSNNSLLLETIIPAVVAVIIVLLLIFLVGWCYWRRKASRKNRRYRSE